MDGWESIVEWWEWLALDWLEWLVMVAMGWP